MALFGNAKAEPATVQQRKSRRRLRKWLVIGAVAVLVVAGLGYRAAKAPVPVELLTVSAAFPYQGETVLNATGYVVAQRKAAVASKANGRLVWLGVREGSQVKADEIIARLESADVEATHGQARANVSVAKANLGQADAEAYEAERLLKRSRELSERAFISQSSLDEAEARQRRARAAVASARASVSAAEAAARAAQVAVDQTAIRAPFDGVVLTKNANVGDVVSSYSAAADSKGAVVTMADMSSLEVEADISESALGKVKVGQACEIQLDALPDQRFEGELVRMVPTVDRSKASVMSKIRFRTPDPRVLPEMSAKVAFLNRRMETAERTPRTAVHRDALVEEGGVHYVFRVENDHAHKLRVTPGAAIGDLVQVPELKPGDRVVRKPDAKLRDGAAVTAAKA